MTATITSPFNEYNQQVIELVCHHTELPDIDLWLAIRYQPERQSEDIFLFEVINGFGLGLIDERKKLFEMSFDPGEFLLANGNQLRMVITSPEEFDVAFEEGWPLAEEIRHAIHAGKYEALFAKAEGEKLLERLRG